MGRINVTFNKKTGIAVSTLGGELARNKVAASIARFADYLEENELRAIVIDATHLHGHAPDLTERDAEAGGHGIEDGGGDPLAVQHRGHGVRLEGRSRRHERDELSLIHI